MQAGGGGVDEHVGCRCIGQRHRLHPDGQCLRLKMGVDIGGQRLRAGLRAVGHHQPGHAGLGQRQHQAPGCAPGTQHRHPQTLQRHTQSPLNVIDQAGAIGVVSDDPAFDEAERVGGTRSLGTGTALVGKAEGRLLEGQRDVGAPPSFVLEEVPHGRGKGLGRIGLDQAPFIKDVLAGLGRKGGVDLGRTAVGNRVAHHQVAVRSGSHRHHRLADFVCRLPLVKVQVRTICRISPSLRISGVNLS